MRRGLDIARARLEELRAPDDVLDYFFEHSCRFFRHAVLLVVRGESAHGRRVHGLEAPAALIEKIVVPLGAAGVLRRAREVRRPFVGIPSPTETDRQLFGMVGRAMPNALVHPLLVRDRVVAFLIGDAPADMLERRARELRRPAIELAREQMLVWSESVSETLEGLIILKKSSMPPPSFGSTPPPNLPSVPPPPRLPSVGAERASSGAPPAPREAPRKAWPQSRRVLVGLAAATVVAIVVAERIAKRGEANATDVDRVVIAPADLPGFPNAVDLAAVLERARAESGLTGAELASIRAEVSAGGRVSFAADRPETPGPPLVYVFVDADRESEVRVDRAGVHAARLRPRMPCPAPCRVAVPSPKCSFATVWDAATGPGVAPQRAAVTYSVGDDGVPTWQVEASGRGRMRIDAQSCKPYPRERLRPPPLPLAEITAKASSVEPMDHVARAREIAGLGQDSSLVGIDATGFDAEGHVDLTSADAVVSYTFSEPSTAPEKTRRWRRVELRRDGLRTTDDETNGPLPEQFDLGLIPPGCTVSNAHAFLRREEAIAAGAHIVYGRETGAHAGRWTLTGRDWRKVDDLDCAAWATLQRR